jgi:hypothetical protein
MTKIYYVHHTDKLHEFLVQKDADFIRINDMVLIKLEAYNDTPFALLMLEFAEYLIGKNHEEFLTMHLN